jgi:hypothetical protein
VVQKLWTESRRVLAEPRSPRNTAAWAPSPWAPRPPNSRATSRPRPASGKRS